MGGPRIPFLNFGEQHPVETGPATAALHGREIELLVMRRLHPNVLLIGSQESNAHALSQLLPACRTPVCQPNPEFDMPIVEGGTFVLWRVELLKPHRQRALHEWFTREAGRIQVITPASAQLFQRVSTGSFLEDLFYRLNTMTLLTGRSTPLHPT